MIRAFEAKHPKDPFHFIFAPFQPFLGGDFPTWTGNLVAGEIFVLSLALYGMFVFFFYNSNLLAFLVAKEYDAPINSVNDVLKSGRPYMSNPGVYWQLVEENYPDLYKYGIKTTGGKGGFDGDVLQKKILDKKYIYGPFGKIESYGRIEEYIRANNGSNPFYIGNELIYYFSQGYAIRLLYKVAFLLNLEPRDGSDNYSY